MWHRCRFNPAYAASPIAQATEDEGVEDTLRIARHNSLPTGTRLAAPLALRPPRAHKQAQKKT